MWDARTGQAVGAPLQHQGAVHCGGVESGRDSGRDGVVDRTAQVWDARTAQAVGAPLEHKDGVNARGVESGRDAGRDGVV